MSRIHLSSSLSWLLVAGILVFVFALGVPSATGGWFLGQVYNCHTSGWLLSGTMDPSSFQRTFGAAPSTLTTQGYAVQYWDEESTDGLSPGQVRLRFFMHDLTSPPPWSGAVPSLADFTCILPVASLPSGATFRADLASITYSFNDHLNPVTYSALCTATPYPSGWCSVFFNNPQSGAYDWVNHSGSLADMLTFEIVVDNLPEPMTIGLLGAGALATMVARLRARRRSAD